MSDQIIKYAELVDVASLQSLMDSMSQAIGLGNAILDTDGTVITGSGWQDACTQFHRVNPETCANCIESDTSLAKHLLQGEDFAIYDCLNGLVDVAMPIILNGQHVANVFIGQCFTVPPDLEFFRSQARRYGFDEYSYLQAIAKVPVIPRPRLEAITKMYVELAQTLANHGLDRLQQKQTTAELTKLNDELARRVEERAEELYEKNLQLLHEKRALAVSEARLSALFKHMSSGVVVFRLSDDGEDFIIIGFNKAAERIEKRTRREVIGKRVTAMFPGVAAFGLLAVLRRVAKTGHPEACPAAYYQDERVHGWRESYVYKLPGGEIVTIFNDVSERKEAEQALRTSEANLKAFFDHSPIGINVFDQNGKVLTVNRAAREMFGISPDDSLQNYCLFNDPAILPETKIALSRGLSASEERFIDFQQIKKHRLYETSKSASSQVYIQLNFTPCFTDNQTLAGYIASIIDTTERKLEEQRLQLTQFSVEWATDCLYWIDPDARIQYVNQTACRSLGYSREELLELRVTDIDAHFSTEMWWSHWQELKQKGSLKFETVQRTKDMREMPVEVIANYIVFEGLEYNCAFVRDISQRKAMQAELERQARTDYLTGIANRRYFLEQGEAELARADRYGNPLSVLMLDIDHFKAVNDGYGHAVGDQVLQKMSGILVAMLREIDISGRLGGEEFAVLLPETNHGKAIEAAERLRAAVADSHILLESGQVLRFTVSIGVATLMDKNTNIGNLLNLADKALYHAKHSGRNKVRSFSKFAQDCINL